MDPERPPPINRYSAPPPIAPSAHWLPTAGEDSFLDESYSFLVTESNSHAQAHAHANANANAHVIETPLLPCLPSDKNERLLSHPRWALPRAVVDTLAARGMRELYEWQYHALMTPNVYENGCNLLYCAPTASGKTLVADLIALRRVSLTAQKALFIVPYVALANERLRDLTALFPNVRVAAHLGRSSAADASNAKASGDPASCDVVVCTIEKANTIINSLVAQNAHGALACVVIDELHFVADPTRGPLLEALLAKLRFMCRDTQLVGMSATLPNLPRIAAWLGASLYTTTFSRIPVAEYVKVEHKVYSLLLNRTDSEKNLVSDIDSQPAQLGQMVRDYGATGSALEDPDDLIPLVWDVVSVNRSALVFCATRFAAERHAQLIANMMRDTPTQLTQQTQLVQQSQQKINPKSRLLRDKLVDALRDASESGFIDNILRECVPRGVAYHHAGLTGAERSLLEGAFRDGTILVLCATVTLASGVNLPARRVIFASPYVGRTFLDTSSYLQMKGRAGRPGHDVLGESIVICKPTELPRLLDVVGKPPLEAKSSIASTPLCLERAILEAIATQMVTTASDMRMFLSCTLLCSEFALSTTAIEPSARAAVDYLMRNALVYCTPSSATSERMYRATALGSAVVASAMRPDDGIFVYAELKRALNKGLILADPLHALYLTAPVSGLPDPDWAAFSRTYLALSSNCSSAFAPRRAVADAIGISDDFITRATFGDSQPPASNMTTIHRRFYAALVISELGTPSSTAATFSAQTTAGMSGSTLEIVAEKYGMARGALQTLQTTMSNFSYAVVSLARAVGMESLAAVLEIAQLQASGTLVGDLADLGRISGLRDPVTARALLDAGLRTAADLAAAAPETIAAALALAPNSARTRQHDDEAQRLSRAAARVVARDAADLKAALKARFRLLRNRAASGSSSLSGSGSRRRQMARRNNGALFVTTAKKLSDITKRVKRS